MRQAGQAAFAKRREDRTAVYSTDGAVSFDADSEAALRANKKAWSFWEGQPTGYRRTAAHWVMSAKRPETRRRRLDQLIRDAEAERRVGLLASPPRRSKGQPS